MNWYEWLIKFRILQYAEGEVGFQAGPMLYVFGVLALLLLVGLAVVYVYNKRLYRDPRHRAVSLVLRGLVLLLLCIPLFEPVLITPDVVPDENFVAVLVDASQSMNIPDGTNGQTRGEEVRQILFDEESGIVPGLSESFKVRYYTFSDQPARVDSIRYDRSVGQSTNLSAALDRVISDFSSAPLAGVVLLTDGGDNSTEIPLNRVEQLRNLNIPLHIVGLGQESFEQEREILDVTVSKGVEETTGAEIDVKVRSWMDETDPVAFYLYRGGNLVFTEHRRLKGGGKIDQLTLFYEPEEPGAAEYRLEIAPAPTELNTANNELRMLIDTRRDTLRVLYFEGHLKQEFKFIKRALEDDQVIEISTVVRPGTGKFYRQGISSAEELVGGFPADEAEMYRYKAVFLGDFEASAFTPAQLSLFERFVNVRGGGFLMLGGLASFAEGQFWDTPVADVLPVGLDPSRRKVIPPKFIDPRLPATEQGFRFEPTAAGYESPILKLSPDPTANRSRWSTVPGLTSINYLGVVKPGAVVLAEKPEDAFGDREPLLVTQRYGKGRSAALATVSTWRWQMHLPAEDARHERFWRQLARWMVASAPNRVNLDLVQQRFAPGEEMPLSVSVYDERYDAAEGKTVQGTLTDPFGGTRTIDFQAELTEPGLYTASFVPKDEGVYSLEVNAGEGDELLSAQPQSFLVRPSRKEYYDATLKRGFLEGLAQANNGFYYAPAAVSDIPRNLRDRRTSTSVYHAEYLWDMPLILGLILLLLSAEWYYRRRKGLP